MTWIPDRAPVGAGASGAEPSLEAGLAALKQGDYPTAIAILEGICEIELHEPTVLRAQMGLVVAYERNGKPDRAIALGQTLGQSDNRQVKEWATKTLASLAQRYPQLLSPPSKPRQPSPPPASAPAGAVNPTGFLPLDGSPAAQPQANPTGFVPLDGSPAAQPQANPTGFVPLDGSPTAQPQANPTGFVPLDSPRASSKKRVAKAPSQSPSVPEVSPSLDKTDSDTGNAIASSAESPTVEELESPNPQIETPPTDSQPQNYQPIWRNAGRPKKTRSLKAVKIWRLQALQIGTAIAFFFVIRAVFQFFLGTTNDILVRLPFLEPIQEFYQYYYNPNPPLLTALFVLFVACPWLLDGLLKFFYKRQPLSFEALATHSPEAVKIIKTFCFKNNLPRPALKLLPVNAPVAFTYGNLPHTACIVVSQGLLERLEDEEIATIYAAELGHIVNWDFALMSGAVLVIQIPYLAYWQVAQWADKWQNVQSLPALFLRSGAAAISALAYGVYWLLRSPLLWLSRQRLLYSDRKAMQLTSNPNALTRALLKIAIGITADIQKQQQTSYLLESFELLMPVSHQQALTLGSLYAITPIEPLLEWDRSNPYRQWLAVNNSHPPLGERLNVLAAIARFWNVETELDWTNTKPTAPSTPRPSLKILLLQGAPFFGVLMGLAIGSVLWLMAWFSLQMQVTTMSWLMRDYQWILDGLLLTGFSLGTIVRVNSFFPDIKPSTLADNPSLATALANPAALPLDSQPIRLEGKLLGRQGIANWLGQDLLLQTNTGLVKLHCVSNLGPFGYLWPLSTRPCDLVNRPLVATGWFRRGATPWIDIEKLSTTNRLTSYSGHPMWSTILAFALALWGVYSISVGGL